MKALKVTKKDVSRIILEAAWEIAKPHLQDLSKKIWCKITEKIKTRRSK